MDVSEVRKEFCEYRELALDFVREGDISGFVEACENIRRVLTDFGKENYGEKFEPSKDMDSKASYSENPYLSIKNLIYFYTPGSPKYDLMRKHAEINAMYKEKEWSDEFQKNAEEKLSKNAVLHGSIEDLTEREWRDRFEILSNRFFRKGNSDNSEYSVYFDAMDSCAERGDVEGLKNLARICVEDFYDIRRRSRRIMDILDLKGQKDSAGYKIAEKNVISFGKCIDSITGEGLLLDRLIEVAKEKRGDYGSKGFSGEDFDG